MLAARQRHEDDVAFACEPGDAFGWSDSERFQPRQRRGIAIERDHVTPALLRQVAAHRRPHHADADEADLVCFHVLTLVRRTNIITPGINPRLPWSSSHTRSAYWRRGTWLTTKTM